MPKSRPRKTARRKSPPPCSIEAVIEAGAPVVYIEFDGVRIAKRGNPDTPEARTWVSLVPGYTVIDGEVQGQQTIEVYLHGERVH